MRRRNEQGSITVWLAVTTFAMATLVGLAVDLGGQVHAQQRAHDLAAQAARAGAEQVQGAPAVEGRYAAIDAAPARAAAQQYLDGNSVHGSVEILGGDSIRVTVTDSYEPKFLSLIGIGTRQVSSTASARLVRTLGGSEQ